MPVQGDAKRDMQRHEAFKASRIAEDRSTALKGEGVVDEYLEKATNATSRQSSRVNLRWPGDAGSPGGL